MKIQEITTINDKGLERTVNFQGTDKEYRAKRIMAEVNRMLGLGPKVMVCIHCGEELKGRRTKHVGDNPEDSWSEFVWECACK